MKKNQIVKFFIGAIVLFVSLPLAAMSGRIRNEQLFEQTEQNRFFCVMCKCYLCYHGNTFSTGELNYSLDEALKIHMIALHGACSMCQQCFSSKRDLVDHYKQCHKDADFYYCQHCFDATMEEDFFIAVKKEVLRLHEDSCFFKKQLDWRQAASQNAYQPVINNEVFQNFCEEFLSKLVMCPLCSEMFLDTTEQEMHVFLQHTQ